VNPTRHHRPSRSLLVRVHAWWWSGPVPVRTDRAQSTVEYALVLLGAAAVALALVAWVTRSDAIGRLFDSVVGRILRQAG
jgi:hypothetical protein